MKGVAKDIYACGNVCDTYSKKHILGLWLSCFMNICFDNLILSYHLVKILKGPIYEQRLAGFATVFQDRHREIQMALLLHAGQSLDSITVELAEVAKNVQSTNAKLNMTALFRKLDSVEEKELIKLVESKGGASKCMEDDNVIVELISARQQINQNRRDTDGPRVVSQRDLYDSARIRRLRPQMQPPSPRLADSYPYDRPEAAPEMRHRHIPDAPVRTSSFTPN